MYCYVSGILFLNHESADKEHIMLCKTMQLSNYTVNMKYQRTIRMTLCIAMYVSYSLTDFYVIHKLSQLFIKPYI